MTTCSSDLSVFTDSHPRKEHNFHFHIKNKQINIFWPRKSDFYPRQKLSSGIVVSGKNRLRGSKPSAFTWITSVLRCNRTTDWKYIYMHIYLRSKINVILAKRNIVVVLRRKPDAMTMLPNVERRHSC